MSRKTAMHKRSSTRKMVYMAAASLATMPFSIASAQEPKTLFSNAVASDSAYAPVIDAQGRVWDNENAIRSKNTDRVNLLNSLKRQNRSGDASVTNALRADLANKAAQLGTQITNTNTSLSQQINTTNTTLNNKITAAESSLGERIQEGQTAASQQTSEAIRSSTADTIAAVSGMISSSEQEVLGAVAIALGQNEGQTFEYTVGANRFHVINMPYDGAAIVTIVGGGAGGNSGYQDSVGYGGGAGLVIDQQRHDVAKGTPIYVQVGKGGLGASNTSITPGSGQASFIDFGTKRVAANGAAGVRQFGCQPASQTSRGHVGLVYHTNNPGDAATPCSGGFGQTAVGGLFAKSKGGSGGGSPVGRYYWRTGSIPTLQGQSDARFGGGGGGGAPGRAFVGSRGFFQDPINGDGGSGMYFTPGSNGADGYVKIRIFDPNDIITQDKLESFVDSGQASSTAAAWWKQYGGKSFQTNLTHGFGGTATVGVTINTDGSADYKFTELSDPRGCFYYEDVHLFGACGAENAMNRIPINNITPNAPKSSWRAPSTMMARDGIIKWGLIDVPSPDGGATLVGYKTTFDEGAGCGFYTVSVRERFIGIRPQQTRAGFGPLELVQVDGKVIRTYTAQGYCAPSGGSDSFDGD